MWRLNSAQHAYYVPTHHAFIAVTRDCRITQLRGEPVGTERRGRVGAPPSRTFRTPSDRVASQPRVRNDPAEVGARVRQGGHARDANRDTDPPRCPDAAPADSVRTGSIRTTLLRHLVPI